MSGNNPLTDKHVGPIVSGQGWDNEYSEIRQKVGLETEEYSHKKTRKDSKKEKISWEDFPVSPKNHVAIKHDNNGYVNHFLCRVIDSYHDKNGRMWDSDKIYVAILDSEHSKYDYLIGHICEMDTEEKYSWTTSLVYVADKTKADFLKLKEQSRSLEPDVKK